MFTDTRYTATLSPDREYRYHLSRTWDVEKPTLAWIMLNPSTADETEDDPTIRRCVNFAKDWGYGSIVVGNLFALRTPDPDGLDDHPDPIGPENDDYLLEIARESDLVIAAWGTGGAKKGRQAPRGPVVWAMLEADPKAVTNVRALDTTKDGHPVHPLYQPKDAEPEPFEYGPENEKLADGGTLVAEVRAEDGGAE